MPRVLLVEDNEFNRDMLSRRLQRAGWQVDLAVDGREALAFAAKWSLDLILMDLSLPELDGWQVTSQLRSNPRTSGIPIIALTAHAMSGDRERAIAAGCNEFETKPIDYPNLLSKMWTFVPRRRGSHEQQTSNSPGR